MRSPRSAPPLPTFRTRFLRMLSTANTCSPMADSSMRRAGGRSGGGLRLFRWRAEAGPVAAVPRRSPSHAPSRAAAPPPPL